MTNPVAPVVTDEAPLWAPQKMYVQFAENGNIRKWTSGPSSDADHMQVAKVYFRFDGDFAALILAGNKLLDTIDAYDTERELLFSHHPDVHAFSTLLDKMPPADIQAEASGELERLRAALAFYADPEAWNQPMMKTAESMFTASHENQAWKVQNDRNAVARTALEGSTV